MPSRCGCTDLRSWLLDAYEEPGSAFPPMISTPGYTLPDLAPLVWHEAVTGLSVGGIHVHHRGAGASNNWILCPAQTQADSNLTVVLIGNASNNILVLGSSNNMHGQIFFHGRGGLVLIGSEMGQRSEITARLWSQDNLFVWGHKCTSNSVNVTIEGDGTHVVLGDDCMLARAVDIRTSDEHAILDLSDGRFLNPPASIHVEPRVWLGDKCTLLKGVHVGYGSIIGNGSVVTRSIPRFCIAAGIPARSGRSGVSWSRFHQPEPGLARILRAGEAVLRHLGPDSGNRDAPALPVPASAPLGDQEALETMFPDLLRPSGFP